MADHGRFHYKTIDDLRADAARLGVVLELDHDVGILGEPVRIGRLTAPNAFVAQPMEGCDANTDGSPGPLTIRRYQRYAQGGAGVIWFEACAVVPEGRNSGRELWLHEDNVAEFAMALKSTLDAARNAAGEAHRPLTVLQLTHSGRYSKPPLIAQHNPLLDPRAALPPDHPLVDDDYLDRLQDSFVAAARLAGRAGFDVVDIKGCHGYLASELLAAHTREGRYGGSFENRTRFLRETVARVREQVPEVEIASRLGVYDALPWPYGWGVDREDAARPDLEEPRRLLGMLVGQGLGCVNLTIGNPYYNPHYGRPYDRPASGGYIPNEHPLEGMARIQAITGEIARALPGLPVVAFGYTWLRQFAAHAAAAAIRRGEASLLGLGRMSLSYPDYPNDLLAGRLDPRKCCLACSQCTQIMRDGGTVGCPVFDREIYLPVLRDGRARHAGEPMPAPQVGTHN